MHMRMYIYIYIYIYIYSFSIKQTRNDFEAKVKNDDVHGEFDGKMFYMKYTRIRNPMSTNDCLGKALHTAICLGKYTLLQYASVKRFIISSCHCSSTAERCVTGWIAGWSG
jgi:hypothetical protein